MGSYYYLAAQLPYLVYGQALPMPPASFRELARTALDPGDAAGLDFCVLNPDPAALEQLENVEKTDFVNHWREWERALRLNLARNRALKFKRDGSDSRSVDSVEAPDHPADAAAAAKAALSMESPLEAEIFLDQARWNAIESFQGIGQFSENAIYAYLLKLLLMERRQAFKTEEGFSEYKTLYASILESAGEPK